jgi:hypothetical protein
MGKKTTSRATFEIVVGSRSETFEVHEHKFVGTLCAGLLSRLGFGRDLSDWELREATGEVVPFDRTEHQAGIAARRHYYLIRVADKPQKGGQPDHKKGTRRRSRR